MNGNNNHNGTNYVISNDESDSTTVKAKLLTSNTENDYIKNDKTSNGPNFESNDFIYDTSNKNGLRMSNWKQRINDEDADSGRLTLASPPPSTFSTITQPQINTNNIDNENNNAFTTRSANTNGSPLSGLGTISTLSNNSTQTRHNSLMLRYEDIGNSHDHFNNSSKNEFANIRRGSQPAINVVMRTSINNNTGYYDSILSESTDPVRILSPRLNRYEFDENLSTSLSNSIYKINNYRTSAVQFQKQEENKSDEKHTLANRGPLKLNLIYGDRIVKNEMPLFTNTALLVASSKNKLNDDNKELITNIQSEKNFQNNIFKLSDDLSSSLTRYSEILDQEKTSNLVKKLLSNNNYNVTDFKTQTLNDKNSIRKAQFDDDDDDDDEEQSNEDLNKNKISNKSDENEELSHPIVSVV